MLFGDCFRSAAGGGVVTLVPIDPVRCLSYDLSDTNRQQQPGVPRWPNQKPVHPQGVTHHSSAVFADRASMGSPKLQLKGEKDGCGVS